jgi:hypothetical protein
VDLQFYHSFPRRVELEQIAAETGTEIVYLPKGEHSKGEQVGGDGAAAAIRTWARL